MNINPETPAPRPDQRRKSLSRPRIIGCFVVLVFALLYGVLSDRFMVRSGYPPIRAAALNIDISRLLGIPPEYPEFDAISTGCMNDPEIAAFCKKTAAEVAPHVKQDTIGIFMIPGNGRDAHGWPFISRDWTTTVQITNRSGGVEVDFPVYGQDGLLWRGYLGNCAAFLALEISLLLTIHALSIFVDGRSRQRAGFPVVIRTHNNEEH